MAFLSLPKFKVPARSKTKAWAKEVLTYAGNTLSLYTSTSVRATVEEKIINIDLYNGIIHPQDFVRVVNPADLETIDSSKELQHYPIAAPLIDLLVGEEINRPYEPLVHVINNIAIEDKQQRMRAYVEEKVLELQENFQGDAEALKQAIVQLRRRMKFGYKDVVEKKATALFKHYWTELGMHATFVEGFRRMYCTGEVAVEIDIVNNEPTMRLVNTTKMRVYGGGSSSRVEDADIIVVEDHYSSGHLIDRYGDQLTDADIEQILNYQAGLGVYDKTYGDVTHEFKPRVVGEILGNEISSNYVDRDGNIRHLRVRWKAYKQVKKIKYQDEATGEEQTKVVAENYKLAPGEVVVDKIWIYDWWIGTMIAADIMVDMKPIPFRYNRLSSLIEGHPGIVGETFNFNERRVTPQMSRMKAHQYLYDVIMDNIITAMSKNIGPILEMDLAKKPNKWDTKSWLKYMRKYNVKFVDSFKEIQKGAATGTLAANVNQSKDQLMQLDFGNYIQQLIQLAEYLEQAMSDMIGVTQQRKGAISNRETVGAVERATSQSSHMTEWYAYKYSNFKTRALNVFIEAAKSALTDNPKKLQNIVDGATREYLSVTEDDFINADLGVFVTNSTEAQAHKQVLEQAAHAYMQNGGEFSFVFDVLFSESMADKRRLIEEHEEDRREQAKQAQEAEQKAVQTQVEAEAAAEQAKLEMEKYKADLDAEVKLKLKEMEMEIKEKEMLIDAGKADQDAKGKILSLQAEMEAKMEERKQKDEELRLKEKEISAKNAQSQTSAA